METRTHQALKRLAVARLFADGCAAAALEVRCPIARFRVDAAGYLDPLPKRTASAMRARHDELPAVERGALARTVIVECKASRADFLTDSRDAERLLAERARLEAARRSMEDRFVKVVEPHLRRAETSLFPEMDDWDFARSRSPSYRRLLDEIGAVEERLHGHSKFWTIRRYALADFLYIAAPAGLIRAHELPTGWGLLEWGAQADDGPDAMPVLRVALAAPPAVGNPAHRARLLRNIAASASRRLARARVPAARTSIAG